MAERLALPTSVHGVAGSNPARGEILPEPKRRFIAQRLSCSPFHRLEMTEILLKGRKTLTHPSYSNNLMWTSPSYYASCTDNTAFRNLNALHRHNANDLTIESLWWFDRRDSSSGRASASCAVGQDGCRINTWPRHTKDVIKMVPVATLLGAQHYKASTGFSSLTNHASLTSHN